MFCSVDLRVKTYKTGRKNLRDKRRIFYIPPHNLKKTSFPNLTFPGKWNEAMSKVRRAKYLSVG